jgi:type IV secretory pathway VirB10-like protein
MRNNETGEFELVVGNRQLLSGFFIVVLLFAVAFAMGYVVGENSRSAKAQTEVAGTGTPGATPGETRPQPASAAPATPPAATPTQPSDPPQPTPADPTPQPSTRPSRDVPPPTRDVPPSKREVPPPSREVPPPVREAKTAPAAAAPSAPLAEAPPGSYWQVLATANRDSAQDMVRSLQDKGLPASLSPGPNNLTRVLVGPYHDTQSLGRAKTELEAAGLHPVRH